MEEVTANLHLFIAHHSMEAAVMENPSGIGRRSSAIAALGRQPPAARDDGGAGSLARAGLRLN
jgi:hypothetical protein